MSALKDHLRDLSVRKRALWLFIVGGSIFFTTFLIIWLFTLQGSVGLFFWFPIFTIILIALIIFLILGPILILADIFISSRKLPSTAKKIAWVFSLICLFLPIGFLSYVGPHLFHPAGSTKPQLLICDGTGKYDIPDMAVVYWTDQPTKDSLEWGEGSLSETIEDKEAKNSHVFVLEDLKPGTEYWYKINDEGDTYKFKTPLGTENTLKFAVSSDPHFGRPESSPDITLELLDQITDSVHNISTFFMLGDFVEYGFNDFEWKEGLNKISKYTAEFPMKTAIGNHDTIFGGEHYYKDYFYPEDMPLDTGSSFWNHIEINKIHFFILDLEWGTESYSAAQREWFESEIEEVDEDDWTIVMSHCFFYSSGIMSGGRSWSDHTEMISTFEDIFIDNDVDMVFSGHNHHAEILEKDGVYYQVVGTFGGLPDPEAEMDSDYSEWYMNMEDDDDFGFFEVDMNPDNATLTFRNRDYDSLKEITIER
mgnify:FL=1